MAEIFPWFSLPADNAIETNVDIFAQRSHSNFIHPLDSGFVNSLIYPSENGPWIAGGACLAWFQNRTCESDIDVYFRDRQQLARFENHFQQQVQSYSASIYNKFETANAKTMDVDVNKRRYKVQLICKDFFKSPQDVINSFDITVCQIAWDGIQVTYTNDFIEDFVHRRLRFHNINHQTHKRLVKYMIYGYEPTKESLKALVSSNDVDWSAKGSDHYV